MTSSLAVLSFLFFAVTSSEKTYANPQDGIVSSGSATISQNPSVTQINQSSERVVIDWRKFDIEKGEITQFIQPSANSIAVNRVNSTDPSHILGQLTANGNVVLINQSGIYIGKDAHVDVGSLIATTHNINDADFMATGKIALQGDVNNQASIINEGTISARDAGLVGLVAPHVENNGVISARLGHVVLASGTKATLDFYGDGLLSFATDEGVTSQSVRNNGKIESSGGEVILTAAAARSVVDSLVENNGTISANSIGTKNGKIVLQAHSSQTSNLTQVINRGKIEAAGKSSGEKGGRIDLLADKVTLKSTSKLDASGRNGGGTIHVGGDYQGTGSLQHAQTVVVENGSVAAADALDTGNGGDAYFWSDGGNWFAGTATARGGSISGDGGFIEVSGKKYLDFTGSADLRTTHGEQGTLLLDPTNIIITSSQPNTNVTTGSNFSPNADDVVSYLSVATLQTAMSNGNVTVSTRSTGSQLGDIIINGNISSMDYENGYILSLTAAHDIIVNGSLYYADNGSFNMRANHDIIINNNVGTSYGSVSLTFGNDIQINSDVTSNSLFALYAMNSSQTIGLLDGVGTATLTAADIAHITNSSLNLYFFGNVDIGNGALPNLSIQTANGGSVSVSGNATVPSTFLMNTDNFSLTGSLSTTGPYSSFYLQNLTAGRTIGIGNAQVGALNIDVTELSKITGFKGYNFGTATAGDINISSMNWGDQSLGFSTNGTIHVNGDQNFSGNSGKIYFGGASLDVQGNISNINDLTFGDMTSININGNITGNSNSTFYIYSPYKDVGLGDGAWGNLTISTASLNYISGFKDYNIYSSTGDINLAARNWDGSLAVHTGSDINLLGDQMISGNGILDYQGSLSLNHKFSGTGNFVFQSNYNSLGLGTGSTGSTVLTDTQLANLAGWQNMSFSIGNSIDVAAHTWNSNLELLSGDTVNIHGDQHLGAHDLMISSSTDTILNGKLFGTGALTLQSYNSSAPTLIGNTVAGISDLSAAELNNIQNGWNQLFIDSSGTGGSTLYAYDWSSRYFANGIKIAGYGPTITVSGAQNFGSNNVTLENSGIIDLNANVSGTGKFTFASPSNIRLGVITGTGLRISSADMATYLFGKGWTSYLVNATGTTNIISLLGVLNWDADTSIVSKGAVTISAPQNFGAHNLTIATDRNPGFNANISGTGDFTLKSVSGIQNYSLNSANSAAVTVLGLTSTELGKLVDGWKSLTFGSANDTGSIDVGNTTWNDVVHFVTSGDVLVSNSIISTDNSSDNTKFVFAGGSFKNSNATLNSGSGRYLVYSTNPTNDIYGSLAIPTKRYNKTYASYAPSLVTESGNVFLYSIAPVIDVSVDNKTREYGLSNPAFTYTVDMSDLINGDTLSTAIQSPSFTNSATLLSNVGNYNISLGLLSDLGYQFNITNGTLSVTKATLTVTADDATRQYGLNNPALGVSYSGFRNGETRSIIDTQATASTLGNINSNVGSYAITASGATDGNYAFSYVDGNLSITKATLQAIADDISRQYGDIGPALSLHYTGFRNGNTAADLDTVPSLSTAATSTSGPGSYAITVGAGLDNNYDIVTTNGQVTVTKRNLDISVNSPTIHSGGTPVYNVSYNGFVFGDTPSNLTVPVAVTDNVQAGYRNAGSYTVYLTGGGSSYYNPIYHNGVLRIQSPIPDAVTRTSATPEVFLGQSVSDSSINLKITSIVDQKNFNDLSHMPYLYISPALAMLYTKDNWTNIDRNIE